MRRATEDVGVAEPDRAVAAINATDAIERACLAGAVRADQREQFARLDRERDIVEDSQAIEAQAQMLNVKLSHTTSATGDIA